MLLGQGVHVDAMMPGLDGFETCRRIKAQPANADIPALFMTALTESRHVSRALRFPLLGERLGSRMEQQSHCSGEKLAGR